MKNPFRSKHFPPGISGKVKYFNFRYSFATYGLLCGVPAEQEGEAIDLLFEWLQSAETNVTTRSRALFALVKLTEKYPELKNELRLCLLEQKELHSKDFRKRAEKIIVKLGQ